MLYETLREKILELDTNISVEKLQAYYGFKVSGLNNKKRSFADLYIQSEYIKIQIYKPESRVSYSDPQKKLQLSKNENWTLGYHFFIENHNEIEYAINLITQSYSFINDIVG